MTRIFDSDLIDNHDLYHLRYGRGAVIVAVRKSGDGDDKRSNRGKHTARLYNAGDQRYSSDTPSFEPVLSIREKEDFVSVTVQFEHRSPVHSTKILLAATIERVIHIDQVTVEIIRNVDG